MKTGLPTGGEEGVTPLQAVAGADSYTRAMAQQDAIPYLDALLAYAARNPGRFHVPGHKGGAGADPGMRELVGREGLAHDIPPLIEGIDVGPHPTPFELAQRLAAEAWGAGRS